MEKFATLMVLVVGAFVVAVCARINIHLETGLLVPFWG